MTDKPTAIDPVCGMSVETATAEDFLDMQKRMLEWYDTKLKGARLKLSTN